MSSVEWSQFDLSDKPSWSFYPSKPVCQIDWDNKVASELSRVANDNPFHLKKEGEISAVESLNHRDGAYGLDTRPKIFDKQTQAWILLDSGSCVSCLPKEPGDVIDQNFSLKAVNGDKIQTYGTKTMHIQLNRKQYAIQAIVADVPNRILGWDFFCKFKLGFEWNDYGDLFLTDNKAGIKTLMRHFAVPHLSVPRMVNKQAEMCEISPQSVYFETECMKALGTEVPFVSKIDLHHDDPTPYCGDNLPIPEETTADQNENRAILERLQPKFRNLISRFPEILQTTFKEVPNHNVFHKIDTGSEKPSKCKVRPLLASSEKSTQFK